MLSATGRTCTVILRRRVPKAKEGNDEDEGEEDAVETGNDSREDIATTVEFCLPPCSPTTPQLVQPSRCHVQSTSRLYKAPQDPRPPPSQNPVISLRLSPGSRLLFSRPLPSSMLRLCFRLARVPQHCPKRLRPLQCTLRRRIPSTGTSNHISSWIFGCGAG